MSLSDQLPIEMMTQIMCFCNDETLLNWSLTNNFYHQHIFGTCSKRNKQTGHYRSTIWKCRLLKLMNSLIDQVNSIYITEGISATPLSNFKENDLDQYMETYCHDLMGTRDKYLMVYREFTLMKFTPTPHPSIKYDGRSVENEGCTEWYSVLASLPLYNKNLSAKQRKTHPNVCFTFRGFEIIIDQITDCGNSWKIVLGIGNTFGNLNRDSSEAGYFYENQGVGLAIGENALKVKGKYETSLPPDVQPTKGDRYAAVIDDSGFVNFYKNGQFIIKFSTGSSKGMWYPIVALCRGKAVTILPLLEFYNLK